MRWKTVPGFRKYEAHPNGSIRHKGFRRNLRGSVNKWGYRHATLMQDDSGLKTVRWNRIVLITFKGPPPPGKESSHINGNRLDNRLRNLKWETRKRNHARKVEHGTSQVGERNGNTRMTCEKVMQLRAMRKEGSTYKDLANKFEIAIGTVSQIVTRKTWRHVED
jgi:hypothetical protein